MAVEALAHLTLRLDRVGLGDAPLERDRRVDDRGNAGGHCLGPGGIPGWSTPRRNGQSGLSWSFGLHRSRSRRMSPALSGCDRPASAERTRSAMARAASSSEARAASSKISLSSACKERPDALARRLSSSRSRSGIPRTRTFGIGVAARESLPLSIGLHNDSDSTSDQQKLPTPVRSRGWSRRFHGRTLRAIKGSRPAPAPARPARSRGRRRPARRPRPPGRRGQSGAAGSGTIGPSCRGTCRRKPSGPFADRTA